MGSQQELMGLGLSVAGGGADNVGLALSLCSEQHHLIYFSPCIYYIYNPAANEKRSTKKDTTTFLSRYCP
jgi:hypothetical protein